MSRRDLDGKIIANVTFLTPLPFSFTDEQLAVPHAASAQAEALARKKMAREDRYRRRYERIAQLRARK